MKKRIALILAILLTVLCTACTKEKTDPNPHHDMITEAVSVMKDYWRDLYSERDGRSDGYFEILNTRVITIKENDVEEFLNVAYIVEFELYTDYLGTAPYYENVMSYDTVVVYRDGTMEGANSLIVRYRSRTYSVDFSGFIDAIDNYGGKYNCVEILK